MITVLKKDTFFSKHGTRKSKVEFQGDYTEEDIRDLLRNIDEILGFCPEVVSF